MPRYLQMGHRRRGAGLTSLRIPDFEKALILSRLQGIDWYVDSNVAAAGNGDSWGGALLTIQAAINVAKAGDRIHVAEGHAETLASATALTPSKAGLKIMGYGRGNRRPTLTLSAVATNIPITGAGTVLDNLLFTSSAACTKCISIAAVDVEINACGFRRTSGTVPVLWIDTTGSGVNGADRLKVTDCDFNTGTNVGANNFIELGTVNDGIEISGCIVFGDFGDACIHNPTGFVLTNLTIRNCELRNLQTGDHAIELVSACTGQLLYNAYFTDMTQQTGVDPGSCFSIECYQADVIDTAGILTPVIT